MRDNEPGDKVFSESLNLLPILQDLNPNALGYIIRSVGEGCFRMASMIGIGDPQFQLVALKVVGLISMHSNFGHAFRISLIN